MNVGVLSLTSRTKMLKLLSVNCGGMPKSDARMARMSLGVFSRSKDFIVLITPVDGSISKLPFSLPAAML